MKKTLAVILVAVMLLSTLVALVVPAAAEGEGNWEVYNTATIDTPDEIEKAPPLPGYYYDELGFHTKSPNYTNFNPKFTVISKEQYNVENFTMTVVVHDYCLTGDNWLSFSVWSESNGLAQGDTSGAWGDGWTSLIRPDVAAGTLNRFESWNATKGGRSGKQVFSTIDNTQLAPVVFEEITDDNGDRVITFAIEEGVVKINGVAAGDGTNSVIKERFKEGLAYVGVTLHNTDNSGAYMPTISIIDVNGETPAGTDTREPENKQREIAPPAPSDSVPVGQPALWFDASMEATNATMPQHTGCDLTFADDNKSFLVNLEQESFQIHFAPPDTISYEAADFPFFAIIYKNFCTCEIPENETPFTACDKNATTHQTTIWTFAGKHSAASPEAGVTQVAEYFCINPLNDDGTSAVEDYYTVAVFEIINPENWTGRINGYRLDVNGLTNYAVEGHESIEILGTGLFRSSGELTSYIGNMKVEDKNFNVSDVKYAFWDCEVNGHIGDEDQDGYCDFCWEEVCVDTDGDNVCDNCGADMTAPGCEHVDEDADNTCDLCGEAMGTEPDTEPGVPGTDPEVPGTDPVEPGTNEGEESTEEATEDATEATTEETTTAKKPASTTASDDDGEEEKKGCKSAVSMGALAIVAIVGTGLVIKKKED